MKESSKVYRTQITTNKDNSVTTKEYNEYGSLISETTMLDIHRGYKRLKDLAVFPNRFPLVEDEPNASQYPNYIPPDNKPFEWPEEPLK